MTAHDVMDVDPLVRPRRPIEQQVLFIVAIAIGALVLHVGATLAISGASWAAGQVGFGEEPEPDRVDVAILDTPPPPEPEPPAPEPEQPEIDDAKKLAEQPETKPEPEPERTRRPPPSDPTNVDDVPPEQPDKPVRRTVGLNLESTVTTGDGPAFNTGNTRMGETERTANDPTKVDRRKERPKKDEPPPEAPPQQDSPNKKAQNIPTKAEVIKPKRSKKVTPDYPAELRAKGIEGTVVVRVQIDATGTVTKVEIVAKSDHPEFDAAARAAAMKETFAPATKDGKAIPYSLSFSYRFRLND